jgi:hypothetical protein
MKKRRAGATRVIEPTFCPYCGCDLPIVPRRKRRFVCASDLCRRQWSTDRKRRSREQRMQDGMAHGTCTNCGIRRRLRRADGRGFYKWCRICRRASLERHLRAEERREAERAAGAAILRETDLRVMAIVREKARRLSSGAVSASDGTMQGPSISPPPAQATQRADPSVPADDGLFDDDEPTPILEL